jgi:hypothetical protein
MYTTVDFKTKKQLKDAVKNWNEHLKAIADSIFALTVGPEVATARPVRFYQPGPFGGNEPTDGTICLEGPHYPAPHTWYAEAKIKNGVVVKVK